MKTPLLSLAAVLLAAAPMALTAQEAVLMEAESADTPATEVRFRVLTSGVDIGELAVERSSNSAEIDYEYRNNGRGPTLSESVSFNEAGLPLSWSIEGATTFGNGINERFSFDDGRADWQDSTGASSQRLDDPSLYVAQDASPFALWIYARALLADDDRRMTVLPAGELELTELETLEVEGPEGPLTVTSYALSGIDYHPDYLLLDQQGEFFATMSPRFAVIREGFEAEDKRLRSLAERYSTDRLKRIQATVAHDYAGPVRIENVFVFDPRSLTRRGPVNVTIEDNVIIDVSEAGAQVYAADTVIDGAGGTLVAGMYEMHGHFNQDSALLNIAAGVTTIRDMGNNNEVLTALVQRINEGTLGGPRVVRSGFIEGASPFSSNNGELVSSEEEAVAAVRRYANGDFFQIKIYNSMNPEWVPAMVAEARANGLRVAGHVPAFSNADAMIDAGYDELTHINQVMLGWVLEPGEDTRTLLRLTALRRLPELDLADPRVTTTIDAMIENEVALDPTLAIHETLLRSRNGAVSPGMVDYVDHLPPAAQRAARTAWADTSNPEDDTAYWQAFDKIVETLSLMHESGILLVPGTDLGGSFTYHRELELYQQLGMSAPELLKLASWDMAEYLGQSDQLGAVEAGMLADFFLVPGDPTQDLQAIKRISMVVKDGTVYFPGEIYPEFGIRPFVDAPAVIK